jgi:hypothetical protein
VVSSRTTPSDSSCPIDRRPFATVAQAGSLMVRKRP